MKPGKADTVFVGIGAIASGLGGFGFTWAVARGLGVAGTGIVLTLVTWFTLLAGVTKLGMDTTLVREGGRIRAAEGESGARALVPWTILPPILLSAALGLGIAISAPWLGPLVLPGSPVPLTTLLIIGGCALPAGVATIVGLALIRGLGQIRPFVCIEQVGKPGVRTVAALLLALFGVTVSSIYFAAWIVPVWVGALATWLVLRRRLRDEPRGALSGAERSRIWRYATPRAASQVADLANTSLGILLLGALAGASAAGQYATAFRIVIAGQLIFQAARLLLSPSLAAMLATHRIKDTDETFSTGTVLIVLAAWPVFLTCLALPEQILSIFGPGFSDGALTLQVLALSGLLLAVVGTQGSVVLMSGRSLFALLATSAALVANLVLTLTLVSLLGPVAAAVGWTSGILLEGILLGFALRRIGVTPLPRQALGAAALTASTVGVGLLVFRLLLGEHLVVGSVVLGAAVVLWLVLCVPRGLRALHTLTDQREPSKV